MPCVPATVIEAVWPLPRAIPGVSTIRVSGRSTMLAAIVLDAAGAAEADVAVSTPRVAIAATLTPTIVLLILFTAAGSFRSVHHVHVHSHRSCERRLALHGVCYLSC